MDASPHQTRRTLETLAGAARHRRSTTLELRDDPTRAPGAVASVLGFSFRGGRWLVTVRWHDTGGLCVLDLRRISSVQRRRRPALPCPATFDPVAFSGAELLGWGNVPQRPHFLRPSGDWRELLRALLPTSRPTRELAGDRLFRLDAAHSDTVLELTRSVGIPAAVCSAPPMPETTRPTRGAAPRQTETRNDRPRAATPRGGARRPAVRPPATRRRAAPQVAQPEDDSAAVRCLRLVSWLIAQREPVTRTQIFAAFPGDYAGSEQATEKKFTRDKDTLRRLGYSLQVVELSGRKDNQGYLVNAQDCTLPAIDFTPDEAALLWSAAVSALRLSAHPLRPELESAIRKLVVGSKGLPPKARDHGELDPGEPRKLSKELETVIDAWERRKELTIDYWRPATGEVTTRVVDVHGWAMRRGEWIFVGRCHLRDATRIFYLSRVRRAKVNGSRKDKKDYDIPEGFDIRDWSRQQPWEYWVEAPRQATVRFTGSLAKVARQLLPGAAVSTDGQGARLATFEIRNLDGLVRQALAWGPEAELLEPAEGRATARAILEPLAGPGAEVMS